MNLLSFGASLMFQVSSVLSSNTALPDCIGFTVEMPAFGSTSSITTSLNGFFVQFLTLIFTLVPVGSTVQLFDTVIGCLILHSMYSSVAIATTTRAIVATSL